MSSSLCIVLHGIGMPAKVLEGVPSAPSKIHARVTEGLRRKMLRAKAAVMMRRALQSSGFHHVLPPFLSASASSSVARNALIWFVFQEYR